MAHIGVEIVMKPQTKQQQYAGFIMSLMEGDTHQIDDMMKTLEEDGMIDENGEEIYWQEEE